MGSIADRTVMMAGGEERGGSKEGRRWMVKVVVERGGRMENGVGKVKLGCEVDTETATDMVCIRFVNLKLDKHFWDLVKVRFSSFTSALTSLSMEDWKDC